MNQQLSVLGRRYRLMELDPPCGTYSARTKANLFLKLPGDQGTAEYRRNNASFCWMRSLKKAIAYILIPLVTALPTYSSYACQPMEVRKELRRQLIQAPTLKGVSLWVEQENGENFAAIIESELNSTSPLTAQSTVRIASITKTYIAATYLRLWEQGLVELDSPITGLLDPSILSMLVLDNYDVEAITPRQLLMHTAGLANHADASYLELIQSNPKRFWTAQEQISLLITDHQPIGTPGSDYYYSDTGYVLLGAIIEHTQGLPLHLVVREQLQFAKLGLDSTCWEVAEQATCIFKTRTHQYYNGHDTFEWNPSVDLYGGGGLVSSPRDMAVFFKSLFSGDVFSNHETLNLMTAAPGQVIGAPYKLGIFSGENGGRTYYFHSGFWGTYAAFLPSIKLSIAGFVSRQEDFAAFEEMLRNFIASCIAE